MGPGTSTLSRRVPPHTTPLPRRVIGQVGVAPLPRRRQGGQGRVVSPVGDRPSRRQRGHCRLAQWRCGAATAAQGRGRAPPQHHPKVERQLDCVEAQSGQALHAVRKVGPGRPAASRQAVQSGGALVPPPCHAMHVQGGSVHTQEERSQRRQGSGRRGRGRRGRRGWRGWRGSSAPPAAAAPRQQAAVQSPLPQVAQKVGHALAHDAPAALVDPGRRRRRGRGDAGARRAWRGCRRGRAGASPWRWLWRRLQRRRWGGRLVPWAEAQALQV